VNKKWITGFFLWPFLAWAQVPAQTSLPPPSKIEVQPRAQSPEPSHAQSNVKASAKIVMHPSAQPSSQPHPQPHARASASIVTQRRVRTAGLPHEHSHVRALVKIAGTVWQPDQEHTRPAGNWQELGAHSLLVQWSRAGNVAFAPGCGGQLAGTPPDWKRIAAEPWAREIIMGLAGDYSETATRRSLLELIQQSRCLSRLHWPIHISAWYFPAEIDPTWTQAAQLRPLLAQLPRPLWVSAYDNANLGPAALCHVLKNSLPADVGVFFQDGVGVHARTAGVSHEYMQGLRKCLGAQRVRLIAEAVRPAPGGGFRAATLEELNAQLARYTGETVWLFEGPHYLNTDLVCAVRAKTQPHLTSKCQ
jgi:hypothetical protein